MDAAEAKPMIESGLGASKASPGQKRSSYASSCSSAAKRTLELTSSFGRHFAVADRMGRRDDQYIDQSLAINAEKLTCDGGGTERAAGPSWMAAAQAQASPRRQSSARHHLVASHDRGDELFPATTLALAYRQGSRDEHASPLERCETMIVVHLETMGEASVHKCCVSG
jgi:hypothetical protein